ncbi:MAG TPA: hypothetical protein VFH44_11095 [Solirubrobacterales bacterium]|nr:hypothetical protein [Solirubrobacterales bacterium]
MTITPDQQATLQLLLERGQSYADLAKLLGEDETEVRARARAALTELGGADPDRNVGLTDYLLGQADPIGRADAIRHLQADPAALDLARRIQTGLAVVVPGAEQPKLPEPRGKRRKAALPGEAETRPVDAGPPDAGNDRDDRRRRMLIAALGIAGLAIVIAVLVLTGVFSSSDSADDATPDSPEATTPAEPTVVPLEPVGGSGVAGEAVFGLSDEQLYVDVDLQGLDPDLPSGRNHVIWLMVGESAGYPIDILEADENGSFSGRLAVPTPIAVVVGNQARSVRVSSTPVRELQDAIKQATEQEVPVLPFVGDELASGNIPLVQGGQQGQGGTGQQDQGGGNGG